jgi:hypothetical protein
MIMRYAVTSPLYLSSSLSPRSLVGKERHGRGKGRRGAGPPFYYLYPRCFLLSLLSHPAGRVHIHFITDPTSTTEIETIAGIRYGTREGSGRLDEIWEV